jgi:hypothetical protein
MTETTKPARKPRGSRKPARPAPEAAKAEEPRPATGPRGELLARKGSPGEGRLASYVVTIGFQEFEVLKAGPEAGTVAEEERWATVCVAHGNHTFTDSATLAERAGARKARAGWCKACANTEK